MSGACSGSIKSWPCIAVPQGSAHFPTNPLETFADALLSQIDFVLAKKNESLANPLPTYFGGHFGHDFVQNNRSCSFPVKNWHLLTFGYKFPLSEPLGCQRPYHVEHTSSRPITEVKQRWAQSVLGWVTAWEHWVLLAFCQCFALAAAAAAALRFVSNCKETSTEPSSFDWESDWAQQDQGFSVESQQKLERWVNLALLLRPKKSSIYGVKLLKKHEFSRKEIKAKGIFDPQSAAHLRVAYPFPGHFGAFWCKSWKIIDFTDFPSKMTQLLKKHDFSSSGIKAKGFDLQSAAHSLFA